MRVVYTNTFQDMLVFALYTHFHSPLRWGLAVAFLAATSLLTCDALPPDADWPERIITFVLLESVAVSMVVVGLPVVVIASLYLTQSKAWLTQHVVTLGEDSIQEETRFTKSEVKWAAVHKVFQTRNHILLYVTANAAHVIPRRAFFDDEEFQAFRAYGERRLADTRSQAPDERNPA